MDKMEFPFPFLFLLQFPSHKLQLMVPYHKINDKIHEPLKIVAVQVCVVGTIKAGEKRRKRRAFRKGYCFDRTTFSG